MLVKPRFVAADITQHVYPILDASLAQIVRAYSIAAQWLGTLYRSVYCIVFAEYKR